MTARLDVTAGATCWLISVTDGTQRIIVGREKLASDALAAATLAGRALAMEVRHHLDTGDAP